MEILLFLNLYLQRSKEMRYWITKEGLRALREKSTSSLRQKLLTGLLESSSGLTTRSWATISGQAYLKRQGASQVPDWFYDEVFSLKDAGLITTDRLEGTSLGYEASLPQTNIDYTSTFEGKRGSEFSIGPELHFWELGEPSEN